MHGAGPSWLFYVGRCTVDTRKIVIPPTHRERQDVSEHLCITREEREGIISFHGNTDIASDVGGGRESDRETEVGGVMGGCQTAVQG